MPRVGVPIVTHSGFNLSILECKFWAYLDIQRGWLRFNLSILECKCQTGHRTCQRTKSFNLSILECKYAAARGKHPTAQRFNLSILECKLHCDIHIQSGLFVLIYPYWNVNVWGGRDMVRPHPVLIYPYWNVNSHFLYLQNQSKHGFNLSILECK